LPRIYRWEKTTAVAVKIKLKRLGKIREPYYRIVVADARTKRDGRAIEEIGKYHPKAEPSYIEVNSERVQHWLSVGAQPTDPVRVLLKITGDWQKFTGEPGAEGTLRTAESREDKKERFTAAAKESQASKEAREAKGAREGSSGSGRGRSARSAKGDAASAKGDAAASAKGDAAASAKGDATAPAKGDATASAKGDAPASAKGDAAASAGGEGASAEPAAADQSGSGA
jgi:small subunit ribosomal protein S16